MRSEGTYPQSGIHNAEQKKRAERDVEVRAEKGDRVELSEQARSLRAREDLAQTASSSRSEAVEKAQEKVEQGIYDRPEVRKEIASRLLDSPAFREILEERTPPIPETGVDRVQAARERVEEAFYDKAEVRSVVAEKLLRLWVP